MTPVAPGRGKPTPRRKPRPVRYRWRARPAPQKEAGPWISAAIAKRMRRALQQEHYYCERYEWILAARVVWGVCMWFGKGVVV